MTTTMRVMTNRTQLPWTRQPPRTAPGGHVGSTKRRVFISDLMLKLNLASEHVLVQLEKLCKLCDRQDVAGGSTADHRAWWLSRSEWSRRPMPSSAERQPDVGNVGAEGSRPPTIRFLARGHPRGRDGRRLMVLLPREL